MDHLHRPKDPISSWEFPVYGSLDYDNCDFYSYPERQGWNGELFSREDFRPSSHKRSLSQTIAFVQTWLYFGLLAAFLDVPIRTKEFTKVDHSGRYLLSTTSLPNLLNTWVARMRTVSGGRVKSLYQEKAVLLNFSSRLSRIINIDHPHFYHGLPRLLGLSIAVLGETIECAYESTLGGHIRGPEIITRLGFFISSVSHRFDSLGWCANDLRRLKLHMLITGELFGSMVKRTEAVSHSQCLDSRCSANDIDPTTYRTRHIHDSCDCDFVQLDQQVVKRILKAGGIPLVSIHTCSTTGELRLDVKRAEGNNLNYTAISHVWSDGLGKVMENSIPRCQAIRMKDLLLRTAQLGLSNEWTHDPKKFTKIPEGRENLFWLDTLCVPLETEFRHLAIARMGDTYGLSHKMIVLDSELMRCSYHDRSDEESLFRVGVSSWMRRIWTLQEAVMAKQFFVEFADGFFDVHAAIQSIKERSVLESECYDPVPLECCQFHHTIRSIQHESIYERFIPAWRAIQTRQTSHRGDEMLCFADMLGMDPSDLLTTKDAGARMKIFFNILPTVPVSILWSTGPKLKEHGYRWAPSSFFGGVVSDGDITPVETDENGLMLCSQGLLLTGTFYDPENSLCVYQDEEEEDVWYSISCTTTTAGTRKLSALKISTS